MQKQPSNPIICGLGVRSIITRTNPFPKEPLQETWNQRYAAARPRFRAERCLGSRVPHGRFCLHTQPNVENGTACRMTSCTGGGAVRISRKGQSPWQATQSRHWRGLCGAACGRQGSGGAQGALLTFSLHISTVQAREKWSKVQKMRRERPVSDFFKTVLRVARMSLSGAH